MAGDDLADRAAFAERLRVQIASRYSSAPVGVDPVRFAVRIGDTGNEATLALAPLQHACLRSPAEAPRLIAEFVASVERQLESDTPVAMAEARLLWCVRGSREIDHLKRAGDLLRVELGAGLLAFVAEALPESIMRGVPRQEWEALGMRDADVHEVATRNTQARFARLLERVRAAHGTRLPADGWRMAGDPLYQGSVLMVPPLLRGLCDMAGDEVLLAVPGRGVVLAIAAHAKGVDRFTRRVLQEWREAMHPCSRELLATDGASLRAVPRRGGRLGAVMMPWLQE